MEQYIENVLDAIGNTPLLKLTRLTDYNVFAKLELLNPGGSIKDRIAQYMIEQAEERGELKPGMTIVEASSGNTGIGLVLVGIQKGYRVVIVMPGTAARMRSRRSR